MEFKEGVVVSLRHFSNQELFRGLITKTNYELITVRYEPEAIVTGFGIGDPIALGFEQDHIVYISSCNIKTLQLDDESIVLKADSLETLSNKRIFERFPVSFNADVKIGASKNAHKVMVKNISFNGMLSVSHADFPLYQEMRMDFFIGQPITLKCIVIRKTREGDYNEYGLKLVYTDPQTPQSIKRYLHTLKKEQEAYVSRLNEPNFFTDPAPV